MSKVLIIPDVHLKPWMFAQASELAGSCDRIVLLGDLVDDWNCGDNKELYIQTLDAARRFAADFPESLWCYGNHDYCYLHCDEGLYNSGFSDSLKYLVRNELRKLEDVVGERYKIVHHIDGVLFSHGGVNEGYFRKIRRRLGEDTTLDECIEFTNEVASSTILWEDYSPLWFRPREPFGVSGGVEGVCQVVGHTPVKEPSWVGDILIADTFSTFSGGTPIGTQTFIVFDTETQDYE